ncbi:MAG: biopolymer transporter ExbD [Planctomycetota bacterium]
MLRIRRHDHEARLDMMPLLDVVFLLLCFFIYSFVVMIRADALSVGLAPVTTGTQPGVASIDLLTIDQDGTYAFDGEPLDAAALDTLLRDFAADPAAPTLYVSLAQDGQTDRGPIIWDLMQRVESVGLDNLVMIGPPTPSPG